MKCDFFVKGSIVCSSVAVDILEVPVVCRKGPFVSHVTRGSTRCLVMVGGGILCVAINHDHAQASDMAGELKEHNIASVSLWPGPVKTETIVEKVIKVVI